MNLSFAKRVVARMPALRAILLFGFHAIVFVGAYALAFLIRFEFEIPAEYLRLFVLSTPVVVATQLAVGLLFGFYQGWWRYVGINDVFRVVFGLTAALALLIAGWYGSGKVSFLNEEYLRAPRAVLLIDWAFAILTLFGARVMIRVGRDRFREASPQAAGAVRRVAIVGAGDAGESLAREIEHRPQLGMKVVAFVDDQRAKWGSTIRGVRVHGPIAEIGKLSDQIGIEEALIAIPSASGKRLRELIQHLSAADLTFKTMPGMDQLVSGKVHVTQLRPVNIEDLMRRQRIDLPGDPVRDLFRGKRVLVTGAGGTIGSELATQIAQFDPERLALVERSEYALYEVRRRLAKAAGWISSQVTSNLVDICDTEILEDLIERERPHIVLHAAAHKHVPIGEENPAEYLRNNCLATRKLAEMCDAHGVERFVLISSDKAINPSSVMGATKRAAEIALLDVAQGARMKATIVRFGNVLGSSGSAIPLFMEQIAGGGPVTVTHPDVTRYFIRTSEAISLVLQAATLGDGGHIFMLGMGEPLNVAELARDLIRLSNHTEDEIPIVFTGLRPGEKMFEEIHMEGESVIPTAHPQIVITKAPQPASDVVAAWLTRTVHLRSGAETLSAIKDLVPEYVTPGMEPAKDERAKIDGRQAAAHAGDSLGAAPLITGLR